ncbi:hypothetical protein K5X82_04815 [Halosquirtibacter xylanolyticus]|nr:hypothetical protein K5X82_04815 [Prolixibacteraceae bacterium]
MAKKKCKTESTGNKSGNEKYSCKKCSRESEVKKSLCKPKKKDNKD